MPLDGARGDPARPSCPRRCWCLDRNVVLSVRHGTWPVSTFTRTGERGPASAVDTWADPPPPKSPRNGALPRRRFSFPGKWYLHPDLRRIRPEGVEMRRWILAAASTSVAALLLAPMAGADTNISDRTYVRHDGGSDVTIASCNDDSPVPTTTDAWAGFYYSGDGGATWTNSLLPGYPTDTSAEGRASPLFGLVTSAGDPVQDWDRSNHLYYGGIAFNRTRRASGSIGVARYSWGPPFAAPDHEFTTLVSRGTPSPIFVGHFEDKIELEADDGAASPFAGHVYVCWARFTGSGTNNFIEFARSTDGGRTWTTQKISESIHGVQGCDIAVTRTGLVFVHWRQYAF